MSLAIGIDIGTSACRACAIDAQAQLVAETRIPLAPPERRGTGMQQDPRLWWTALTETLDQLCSRIDTSQVHRLALDATSSTLLLCSAGGTPLTPALMYNDARSIQQAAHIRRHAPPDCPAHGPGSSLAKLLFLAGTLENRKFIAAHQADWLTGQLCGIYGHSDENNVLKMGYDVARRRWPGWMAEMGIDAAWLPVVHRPGTPVGTLDKTLATRWGMPGDARVLAGTTDSTAGFIAAGATRNGTAVTALGSTLVIKVLSKAPVFSAAHGVYSHRLGDHWIVGGASNAGGTVIRELFSDAEVEHLTTQLNPDQPTGLDYYPLPAPGERFPLHDPNLQPRLSPRPASDAAFFQGILEGLARIEKQGYRLLEQLGAPYPVDVLTVGGGAQNPGWQCIRARLLEVPVHPATHKEAAYGAALLALRGQTVFPDP